MIGLCLAGCNFDTSGLSFDADAGNGVADAALFDAVSVVDAPVTVGDAPVGGVDAPVAVVDAPVAIVDAAIPDAPVPDAVVPDGPLPDAANQAGGALEFDGTNDVVGSARQVAGDFTIEAWIKTSSSRTGTQHYQGLGVTHADVAGNANDFGTAILNDRFAFGTGNPDVTIQSTTLVTTGAWVHVAATRDRSTGIIRLYVNGTQEAMVATTNTNNLNAATNLAIGGNTIDNRYFAGTMDEVRVWNSVRSGAQISANMNTQLVGNEAGLVNYWRLDDGSGVTAADSAGSNDGVLGAGQAAAIPTWVASDAPIF